MSLQRYIIRGVMKKNCKLVNGYCEHRGSLVSELACKHCDVYPGSSNEHKRVVIETNKLKAWQVKNKQLLHSKKGCGCGSKEKQDEHFEDWKAGVEQWFWTQPQSYKLLYADRLHFCSKICGKLRIDDCPVCATLLKAGFVCPEEQWNDELKELEK